MTDKQIIEAVGICRAQDSCRGCPFHELYISGCVFELMKDVFDLINRQAAEIESLEHRKTELQIRNQELQHEKSEAIKEFAERLKEKVSRGFWDELAYVDVDDIDNLVKEMTEVQE